MVRTRLLVLMESKQGSSSNISGRWW